MQDGKSGKATLRRKWCRKLFLVCFFSWQDKSLCVGTSCFGRPCVCGGRCKRRPRHVTSIEKKAESILKM